MPRLLLALLAALLAGCSGSTARGQDPGSGEVVVFAAASLTEAFSVLAESFEADHPGAEVVLNLGGSNRLAAQLLSGAPGDVFAAADERQMERVAEGGLLAGEPTVLARNRLAIAVERGNPLGVRGLADLARPELVVVLPDEEVPAGRLAAAALASAGVRVTPASLEPDVRSALSRVALGEADAAVVYASDLVGSEVQGIEIPAEHNRETSYPIAVLSSGANRSAAEAFVEHVLSEQGRAALERSGLMRP